MKQSHVLAHPSPTQSPATRFLFFVTFTNVFQFQKYDSDFDVFYKIVEDESANPKLPGDQHKFIKLNYNHR